MKRFLFILLISFAGKFALGNDVDTSYRSWINDQLDESYELSFSQLDTSIRVAKNALDSSLYYQDTLLIRDSYLMIGDAYGWFSVYDSGNYYLDQALDLSWKLKDTSTAIYIQSLIGLNCVNAGEYRRGMQTLLEAERLSNETIYKDNLGWINYYMTLAYHDQENFTEKVNRLNDALGFFLDYDNRSGILSASADLLVYYLDEDNKDSVQKYYDLFLEAYQISDDAHDDGNNSYYLYTQAYYEYRNENYDDAEKLYIQAIQYADSTEDYFSGASYSLDYMYLLLDQNRVEDAWLVVKDAAEAAKNIESAYIHREVAYGLSDYYVHIGNWELAYQELVKANDLNDSITKNRIDVVGLNYDIDAMKEKEKSYELESQLLQKESDIRLLILTSVFLLVVVLVVTMGYVVRNNQKYKTLNRSLVKSQEKVEKQKKELEESRQKIASQHELVQNAYETQGKIMSIVGHDLRTPLAQIKNILELERSGALSPIEKTEIFKELERTTVASLEMLSSLVNWGKAKLQSDGSTVTSSDAIKALTEECNELYSAAIQQKNIHLSFIETDRIELPISQAETAVLIRNIVYNAIKFSNQNGDVQVEVRYEEEKPTVLIRDFGIGMTQDQVRRLTEGLNIESIRGTSNEGGFGLGMWFVRDITLRNDGLFNIESAPDKGSEFKIQFNPADPK